MDEKQYQCQNFKPKLYLPSSKQCNIKDHSGLQSSWQTKIRNNHSKYIPKENGEGVSSLVVIYPNDTWIVNSNMKNKSFMYACRRDGNIEEIDDKWKDKQLVEFMHQLWIATPVSALLMRLNEEMTKFWECRKMYDYCMTNKQNCREGIIDEIDGKLIQINGLKNFFDYTNVGLLIHLQVDNNFSVQIPDNPLSDSNFFIWMSFNQDNDLTESILVTNCYVWNTFMDIGWKHDSVLSADYNLNINNIQHFYNREGQMEMKSDDRVSLVTPNQMIEMDTLWNKWITGKYSLKKKLNNESIHQAAGILVANSHYQQFWCNYFPIDKNTGFQMLYVHHYDRYRSVKDRYEDSIKHHIPLFVSCQVSCNYYFLNKLTPVCQSEFIDIMSMLGSEGYCNHFWLKDCIDSTSNNILKYMTDLTQDFMLPRMEQHKFVNKLFALLQRYLSKYLVKKWCLSLYSGVHCESVSRQWINKYKPHLSFENGWELLIVYQKQNFPLIYVDNFVCECKSQCTVIQMHKRSELSVTEKGIRVVGCDNSTVLVLFRIVPVVTV